MATWGVYPIYRCMILSGKDSQDAGRKRNHVLFNFSIVLMFSNTLRVDLSACTLTFSMQCLFTALNWTELTSLFICWKKTFDELPDIKDLLKTLEIFRWLIVNFF